MSAPLQRVLERLEKTRKIGGGWQARCPAHEDGNPSLSVSEGKRGVILHCHAGCTQEAVVAALGLEWGDLFTEPPRAGASGGGGGGGRGSWSDRVEAAYDYTDEDGRLLYQAVRLRPKDFRQRRPDEFGGWTWKLDGVRRVLYRLPQVVEAAALGKTVYVVEGEKDVHALESLAAVATTNPMGAGKWRPEYSASLRGAHVRIIADKDDAGREHATAVAEALEGVAASVEVLHAREGKDAHDHVAAGYGLDDFVVVVEDGAEEDEGDNGKGTRFLTLAELLDDPSILDPPEPVIPRIAWRGHATIIAAADKVGKSTFAATAVTELVRGGLFLDGRTMPRHGHVLWLGLEESVKHAVRRFHDLGADPERVTMVVVSGPDLLEAASEHLREQPADLVVVDSIQEYARTTMGAAPSDGDNGAWGAVVRPLVALARTHDTAVLMLHHVRRSDQQARGAGEILAAADALLEMARKKDADPRVRIITGRARWDVHSFSVILAEEGGYHMHDGTDAASVDVLILDHLRRHPYSSRAATCDVIGKRKQTVIAAINRMVEEGTIMEDAAGLRIRGLTLDLGDAISGENDGSDE